MRSKIVQVKWITEHLKKTNMRILFMLLLATQIQAQQSWCDSLTTQHYPVAGISITLTSIPSGVDSVEVLWTACNTSTCYSANGVTGYFPLISLSDTVKLCYDAWLYENNTIETCSQCDSLVFDQGLSSWIMFSSQGNPLSINEITNKLINNKMYDLYGREIFKAKGVYIQNRKVKYVR